MFLRSSLLFGMVFACVMFLTQAANAQDSKASLNIAVVDVEKILSQSKAGKSIQRQLTSRRETFQKEFSKREDDLMNAEKVLIEQQKTMSADEFATKRKEFEKKLLETRNLFQKRRNSLDKGLGNALSQLRKGVIQNAAEVADEENYAVVLTRDSVVIVEKELDITDKVLARLNKNIADIKLEIKE